MAEKPTTVIGKHVNVNVHYEVLALKGKWAGCNEDLGIYVEAESVDEVEKRFKEALLSAPKGSKSIPWRGKEAKAKAKSKAKAEKVSEELRAEDVEALDPPEKPKRGKK